MRRKWYWGIVILIVILFTAGVSLLTQRNNDMEPEIVVGEETKQKQRGLHTEDFDELKEIYFELLETRDKQKREIIEAVERLEALQVIGRELIAGNKRIKELTAAAEAGDISWSEVRRQVNRIAQQSNQLEEFLNDAD